MKNLNLIKFSSILLLLLIKIYNLNLNQIELLSSYEPLNDIIYQITYFLNTVPTELTLPQLIDPTNDHLSNELTLQQAINQEGANETFGK
jgi:hypothetical protein